MHPLNHTMTAPTIRKIRLAFGWVAMSGAIAVTALVGYHAHQNTMRQQGLLAARQDVIDISLDSDDRYPLCILDSAGGVVVWNSAMETLTGISRNVAKSKGFDAIMCDPIKRAKHVKALSAALTNTSEREAVTIVNCEMKNVKTGERIPVRITVRVLIPESIGKPFAVARVDRESSIREIGTPSEQRQRSL